MSNLTTSKKANTTQRKNHVRSCIDDIIINECLSAGPLVVNAVKYHLDSGGSRQRALLSYSVALALDVPEHNAMKIAACVEMLHNASLIHDDIQDKDMRRRNKAALWVKYGKDQAICIGDSLITAACSVLATVTSEYLPMMIRLMNQRTQETIRGQLKDMDSKLSMDLVVYQEVAREKAAPLICLAVELPCWVAGNNTLAQKLSTAATCFAIAYQYSDDINDMIDDRRAGEPNIVNLVIQSLIEVNAMETMEVLENKASTQVKQEIQVILEQGKQVLGDCEHKVSAPLLTLIQQLEALH